MKTLKTLKTLIPLILLISLSLSNAEEMLSFLGAGVDGKRYKYEYPLSKVKKLPEWDMKGETPISFDTAVKKAWGYAQKQYPDVKLFLEEVELDPRGYRSDIQAKGKKICWVYRFEFVAMNVKKDLHKVVMLMDGTIVVPRLVVEE